MEALRNIMQKMYDFSEEDIEYALAHITPDRVTEAEDATYVVESLGDVNWNQQAVNSMRWFMQGGHAREKLIEILREDKFTEDQINYALKVCDPK